MQRALARVPLALTRALRPVRTLQIEDYYPTQEFTLTPAEFDGRTELKLKFHKFQKVSSLHVRSQRVWRVSASAAPARSCACHVPSCSHATALPA